MQRAVTVTAYLSRPLDKIMIRMLDEYTAALPAHRLDSSCVGR